MDTKVTTDMHIEAPVEKVYAFAADMENWNQLKKSGMRGTIQTVEKTPDGVGTTYRAFGHLVGGLSYEIHGPPHRGCAENERVVQTTDGRVMKTLLSGATALSMRPEGSGTHLTVEYSPPTIEKIPVLGSILGGLIEKEMVRAGEPMWAELKELLEETEAA